MWASRFGAIALLLLGASCRPAGTGGSAAVPSAVSAAGVNLTPASAFPLYHVQVEDAAEAALIAQQLGVKPVLVQQRLLYFRDSANALSQLRAAGYAPVRVRAETVEERIVRVKRTGTVQDLTNHGVTVINIEPEYLVARGTLQQLALLQQLGFELSPVGANEPRPRSVRVTASKVADVETINALHVDIYSWKQQRGGVTVWGAAFDSQIAAMERAGFRVERLAGPAR